MSKKATQISESVESTQPAFIEELIKNGSTVLNAQTYEELTEMVDDIPAECRYSVGAIAKSKEDGSYSLRVDLIKP